MVRFTIRALLAAACVFAAGCGDRLTDTGDAAVGGETAGRFAADSTDSSVALPGYRANEFHISCWHGVPADQMSLEAYQQFADAGFTMAPVYSGLTDREAWVAEISQHLDYCQQVGIKARVYDPKLVVNYDLSENPVTREQIRANAEAAVAAVASHPAFGSFHLVDEPDTADFRGLRIALEEIWRADPTPSHAPYLNLFPNYAHETQLGVSSYEEYVRTFADMVDPPYLCFDNYTLFADNSEKAGEHYFYPNLYAVRMEALARGLPWRAILQSCRINEGHRAPTAEDIRWQAWSALCFGGRGIEWFVYYPGSLTDAIVGADGSTGERYEAVKEVNGWLRAYAPYIENMVPIGMYHPTLGLWNGYGPSRVGVTAHYVTGDWIGPVSVGEFAFTDGREDIPLIVMNRAIRDSTTWTMELPPEFESYRIVDRETGELGETIPFEHDGSMAMATFTLRPGDGELIVARKGETGIRWR